MFVYYSIYKRYKGLFKRKHSKNIHLLMVPSNSQDFLYIIIIGEMLGEKDTYIGEIVYIGKQTSIPRLIEIESVDMGKDMLQLEKVPCNVSQIEKGFEIKISGNTLYLPASFKIVESVGEYFNKESGSQINSGDKTIIIKGKFKLVYDNITPNQYRMVKAKKMAFFQKIKNTVLKKFRRK